MSRRAVLLITAVFASACGGESPTVVHSPSPKSLPSASASSPSPSAGPLTGTYGLGLSAGMLMMIKPDASVPVSVPVAAASTQYCSPQRDGLVAPPPVSASDHEVYFRDGDTKIRKVVAPASAEDVTTVPGGQNIISFFSVSPDDQQIAVVVEDVSSGTAISVRLYVEDLRGGAHHVELYSAQTPKDARGTTLWPMGWHASALVLAVMRACTNELAGVSPSEWHVSNAANGTRIANVPATNCTLSNWPSTAGVACLDAQGATRYDWAGKGTSVTPPGVQGGGFIQAGLSPSGSSVFFATGSGAASASPTTRIVTAGAADNAIGHPACLFIDDRTLLAPDAIITLAPVVIRPLAQSGVCAGRFPGGL
ncbi:MAG: hypothetical protein NVS1B3_08650 [Candidatus Dormibacteraceae bacterium]